jgi:hypothetical protein
MEGESFKKLMATNVQKLTQASAKSILQGRSNRQIGGDNIGFLKAPFTDVSGTGNAQKALRNQSSVSCREAAQVIESFVALLEAKAIDMSNERVAGLMLRVRELLECEVAAA